MNIRRFRRDIRFGTAPVFAYAVVYAVTKGACPTWWFTDVLERLIPVVIGLAGAWLAYVFNRRNSYLTGLPRLWRRLVRAVQAAIAYTHYPSPNQKRFDAVKKGLSTAIDEVRGHFGNIDEEYPFPELKRIYDHFERLDPGRNPASAPSVRTEIVACWKGLRDKLLPEFDRA